MRFKKSSRAAALLAVCASFTVSTVADAGEKPALGKNRISQERIANGSMSLDDIRAEGLRIFTIQFNRLDGYGDGPRDPERPAVSGNRPTLAGNGTFLRIGGLDAQGCNECHGILSNATVPPRLGVGGVGGIANNALIDPTFVDPTDLVDPNGVAEFDGRISNPPFIFGAGGIELLALEMTAELRELRARAIADPGVPVSLITKGVEFGTIVADQAGAIDTSNVEGIDNDLVVRPFGRKGEFATTRAFDIGAMQFHFGIQPIETVGTGNDADGDGVIDEIRVGELSALHAFVSGARRPRARTGARAARLGSDLFDEIGCASCHIPSLDTVSRALPLRFPEVETEPSRNTYMSMYLEGGTAGFARAAGGGLVVPLFADLKKHDMGPGLAETASFLSDKENRTFTTARLWGVADTAPYLHDGRATTLDDAIRAHGGDAEDAKTGYEALSKRDRDRVVKFLQTLRTPLLGAR